MDFLAVKASDIGIHLVRPLPTLFAYARGAASGQIVSNVLEEEFFAHVDCLKDLLETACLRARIPGSVCREVTQKILDLGRCERSDLIEVVNELLTHLDNLARVHKSALRNELSAKPEVYRDIFWGRVYTKKIALIHQEDSPEAVSPVADRLRDRCSYEVTLESEKEVAFRPMSSDTVVFLPTRGPIRGATLSAAEGFGLPILILMDLGKSAENADPVAVRIAHQYTKSGYNVLHGPFSPLRLFTAVDTCYVDHLFRKPNFAGARARSAVA
jgi:hypothetical protein